jgi:hypothetical protein
MVLLVGNVDGLCGLLWCSEGAVHVDAPTVDSQGRRPSLAPSDALNADEPARIVASLSAVQITEGACHGTQIGRQAVQLVPVFVVNHQPIGDGAVVVLEDEDVQVSLSASLGWVWALSGAPTGIPKVVEMPAVAEKNGVREFVIQDDSVSDDDASAFLSPVDR